MLVRPNRGMRLACLPTQVRHANLVIMAAFVGGSAHAMAAHIADGNVLVTPVLLKKYSRADIMALSKEIEKIARDVRAENPAVTDTVALQKRNRKLSRMNQAQLVIRNYVQTVRG